MDYFSDEELVRLYVETKTNTYFEQLYKRYYSRIIRKCQGFTSDPIRAEDLTHDIFLKLVMKLSSFQGRAKFSTWLYSLTRNYCIEQLYQKRGLCEVYIGNNWVEVDIESDEEVADMAEQELWQFDQALEQLPPEAQAMLKLKYQHDVSIRDIASLNGISENAVKMRLKRSRDNLRKNYFANFG